ncbi:hypothetical protein SAMN02746066_04537 [Anaerosporobacter mobilis DSM 15930]|jgi:vacuolar-type H+-ATPase subunit D/Vma8|uniref:Uncharacterized protein n=1 Tax=Anaerosporobacter mobilis DSM 15930 TaxID=1120996 RepID=A0A1M7NIR2_9FIRM|nr:hypothetical protein [Anaerosporobacter mobilis]SHN03742.1 hypothetical protein SAMN02746066_04537 [Anaerosporobacter mobilis DSM 15930]
MYQLADSGWEKLADNVAAKVRNDIDGTPITIDSTVHIVTEVLKEYIDMASRQEKMDRRRRGL